MWNYLFFKAYLTFKDKTEFSGNESYIWELIKTLDVSWIPIKMTSMVTDDEESVEAKQKRLMLLNITEEVIFFYFFNIF